MSPGSTAPERGISPSCSTRRVWATSRTVAISSSVEYDDFETWWQPFTLASGRRAVPPLRDDRDRHSTRAARSCLVASFTVRAMDHERASARSDISARLAIQLLASPPSSTPPLRFGVSPACVSRLPLTFRSEATWRGATVPRVGAVTAAGPGRVRRTSSPCAPRHRSPSQRLRRRRNDARADHRRTGRRRRPRVRRRRSRQRPTCARRDPRRPAAADRDLGRRRTARRRDHVPSRRHRRDGGRRRPCRPPARGAGARRRPDGASSARPRRRRPSIDCCAGSSPTRSSSGGRPAWPSRTSTQGRRRPAGRRDHRCATCRDSLAELSGSEVSPSIPRSWRRCRTTSRPRAETRPTSSSRRSPRRGASTAPTRPSGRRSPPTTATIDPSAARPAARGDRRHRRAVRPIGVRRQRRHRVVHRGHDDRAQGRDPQPPVGRRAVRRRQHRRRRRHPRRARRRPPADRRHRRVVLRPPDLPSTTSPTARCTRCGSARRDRRRRRLRQQDRPADRRRRRPLRPRLHHQPARVLRVHRRRRRMPSRRPARIPATASSCSAAAPAATASAAPRSPVADDGRDHRRGRRRERADRRPGHREAADRRARRRRRICSGRRSPTAAPAGFVGGRRDGRGRRRRRRARPRPAQVPRTRSPGRSGCRGAGADGRRRPTRTASAELRERCDRHGVELADLGSFTGDGRLVVRHATSCSSSTPASSTTGGPSGR